METKTTNRTSYGRIIKHSSVYMFGVILGQLVSFIMLPIYTRYLSPGDYGVLELLTMTTDVVAIIIGVGLPAAVFRFYSEKETKEAKNLVISTALVLGSILFASVFGLMLLNAKFFSYLLFGGDTYVHHFRVLFGSMIFFTAVEIPLIYVRAQAKSVKFVTLSSLRLVLQLSLNILFIVFLGYGVLGVLYSTLITHITFSIYLVVSTVKNCGTSFSRSIAKELISYGFPLVFSHLGAFILTFSDRYFIKAYFDLNEVGLYSLGYRFGTVATGVLFGPFFTHWAMEMFEIDKRDDREKVFVNIFNGIFFISLFVIFVECIYIKEAIRIIAAPEYLRAYTVVPIICLAYYFSMQMYYVSLGVMIRKVTKYVAYATICAVVINIGLNFLLIPEFGMYGAAVATLISFFIRFILVYRWSQKVYPLPYRWTRLSVLLLFGAVMVGISFSIDVENIALGLLKDTIVLIVFVIAVLRFWMKTNERELMWKIVRNPKQGFKALKG